MPAIWSGKGLDASADMIWVVWATMFGSPDDEDTNDICNKSTSIKMKHVEPMATVAVWSQKEVHSYSFLLQISFFARFTSMFRRLSW